MQFQDWMFDKRVVRRNVRRGMITNKDVEQYLETLPDMSDHIADPELDREIFEGKSENPPEAKEVEEPTAEEPQGE